MSSQSHDEHAQRAATPQRCTTPRPGSIITVNVPWSHTSSACSGPSKNTAAR